MVIYRPHRGGLAEAMENAREFQDFDEMKRYIYEQAEDFNGAAQWFSDGKTFE